MKIKYCRILMWLLILSPIVDNVNGYLLLSQKESSISIVFKIIIFLLCLLILLKNATDTQMINWVCIALIFVVQLFVFEMMDRGGVSYNISKIIKLLMPIVLVLSLYTLVRLDKSAICCLDKVTQFYCWFFPSSLLITKFLDIGFKTYGSSNVGNKGFYYAGNEIGVIMIMVLTLEIEKYRKNRTKINFINVILGILSILFIGTKSSYFSLTVLMLTALFAEKNIGKKLLNVFLIVPLIGAGLWYVVHKLDAVIEIVNMIVWKYKFRATGIINFLLSGRELKLFRVIQSEYNERVLLKILFGISPNRLENEIRLLVEMDLGTVHK